MASREDQLIEMLRADERIMTLLRAVRSLGLTEWCIAAGTIRNKVWDDLHSLAEPTLPSDVDVLFFDPVRTDPSFEHDCEARLAAMVPGVRWEVVNQATIHAYTGDARPYSSIAEAMSRWADLVTSVGAHLSPDDDITIIAPAGLDDLFDLRVRPNLATPTSAAVYRERVASKGWQERWPKLTIEHLPADPELGRVDAAARSPRSRATMTERHGSVDYDGELAQAYEPGRTIPPEAEHTWRTAVQAHLSATSTVLDVGAGTGRFARLLAELTGRVIAVEPASGMRAVARRVSNRGALHWLAGTAEHLPLADASADVVWTAYTTHYFDLDAAGHELRRVLRGDGHLLVWHAFEDVYDELEWYRWFPSARQIDEQRMPPFDRVAAAFAGAGLELIERTTHQMLTAHDLHELADRLAHRAISTLQLISDEEFEQGLRDLRRFADRGTSDAVYSPNVLAVFRPR